jgi:hypothetical protein
MFRRDPISSPVAQLLPPGSVLCIEACCSPRPVLDFLNARKVEPTIKLPRGTLLPRSEMFHLPVTEENLRQLDKVIAASDAGASPTTFRHTTAIRFCCNGSTHRRPIRSSFWGRGSGVKSQHLTFRLLPTLISRRSLSLDIEYHYTSHSKPKS